MAQYIFVQDTVAVEIILFYKFCLWSLWTVCVCMTVSIICLFYILLITNFPRFFIIADAQVILKLIFKTLKL